MLGEKRQVLCRCGEVIATEPSLGICCPYCGRRLFRECRCGKVIGRSLPTCPHCGFDWASARRRFHRPPLRLREAFKTALGWAALGFTLGIVLSVLGRQIAHWIYPFPSYPQSGEAYNPAPSLGSNNPISLYTLLFGIALLIGDILYFLYRLAVTHPIAVGIALVGGILGFWYAAQRQEMTWHRLLRHLRRKFRRRH